jgi:integrase
MANKRGRRANGEGGVYQRAAGGWEGKLSYIDAATGKRRRVSVYGKTRRAAVAALDDARKRVVDGGPPRDSNAVTVAGWLARWRETTLAVSDRKPATRALYATLAAKHIEADRLGALPLGRVRASDVEAWVLRLRSQTKPGRAEGAEAAEPAPVRALSDSTIRTTYTVLRAALDAAVRDGLIARNPAAAVHRPGVARAEARHLDAAELAAVLDAAKASRYHLALVLIAATGLRRGEALALKWTDVDLDAGLIRVRGTLGRVDGELTTTEPKTDRSRRTVPLSPAIVEALRAHRKRQRAEKMHARNIWTEQGLVFCTEAGHHVEPRNLLRVIETAARKASVKGVGVHTLRHSAATAWLEAGVHIKTAADLLGHSSIAITGDIYSHASDDSARAAVEGLSATLGL